VKITLNFEAPGQTTWDLTGLLHDLFASPVTRIRVQHTSYQGPEGPVHANTFIAEVVTPLHHDAVIEACYVLSVRLAQDCVAVRHWAHAELQADVLRGPRADKWLPFNPEFFLEY
jgi:hypothetical protein